MADVGSPGTPGAGRTAHITDHAILKAFVDGHHNDPDHYLATLLDVAPGVRNPGDILTWLSSQLAGFSPPTIPNGEVDAAVNVSGNADGASTVPSGGGTGALVTVTRSNGAGAIGVTVPAVTPWGTAPAWPVYVDAEVGMQRDVSTNPMALTFYVAEATSSASLGGAGLTALNFVDQDGAPTGLAGTARFTRRVAPCRVDPSILKVPRTWGLAYVVSGQSASGLSKVWATHLADVAGALPGQQRAGTLLRALRFVVGS